MLEELVEAATNGDLDTMRLILQKEPELISATMPDGRSTLTAALYYGRQDVVEFLLELGVPVTVHEAAALGDQDTLAYMLEQVPRLITEVSFDGWTPLHLACFFGGYEAVKLLLERGADVNARSSNRTANMPIHLAAAGKRTAIVELLLEQGADPNAQKHGGSTPLHQAADNFDIGMIELLLRYGADPNLPQEDGRTPRGLAEEKEYTDIVEVFRRHSQ